MFCDLIRLTGKMPFNGETYDEIVVKNHESKVDLDFEKMNISLSKECFLKSLSLAKMHA